MAKLKIKQFVHDSVAAGAPFSGKWDADRNYIIKWIWFKRKDGNPFTASDVSVWIAKDPITIDKALVSTFGTNPQTGLPINEPLGVEQTFEYSGVNNEGATISFVVELILEVT
jgi:hypothetical protein